jgi:protein TonB
MLFVLAASGGLAARDHAFGSNAASLCIHAAVIACAVALSNRAVVTDDPRIIPTDPLIWNVPDRAAPLPAPRPAGSAPGTGLVTSNLIIPVETYVGIPPSPGIPIADPGLLSGANWPLGAGPGTVAAPSDPVSVGVVEELPVLLSFPAPRYPELLRQAGVEGRVTVGLVLDTLGRAEPASVRILSSTHRLFEPAAAQVVLGSTYSPGRLNGRAVRVRIQVPVTFELRRR